MTAECDERTIPSPSLPRNGFAVVAGGGRFFSGSRRTDGPTEPAHPFEARSARTSGRRVCYRMCRTGSLLLPHSFRPKNPQLKFPIFTLLSFLVVIYSNPKVKIVKAKTVAGGSVLWIEFTTSPSSEAALMAAASRAMRRAGEILFSSAK
ncbi:hypothetical protein [Bradyrhizobium sp. I1.14.4]|uniref:hypothetical protein n=1 Tax=unclassified Bradyrhizobium TaxID=2631580 RepID=UPI003D1B20D8